MVILGYCKKGLACKHPLFYRFCFGYLGSRTSNHMRRQTRFKTLGTPVVRDLQTSKRLPPCNIFKIRALTLCCSRPRFPRHPLFYKFMFKIWGIPDLVSIHFWVPFGGIYCYNMGIYEALNQRRNHFQMGGLWNTRVNIFSSPRRPKQDSFNCARPLL